MEKKDMESPIPTEKVTKFFRSEIKKIDKENHRALITLSDQSIDSYQEIIDVNGWMPHMKRFNEHPILLSSHTYNDLRKQIGMLEPPFVDGTKLVAWAKYFVGEGNPEADWAWVLTEKGISAYSVGFQTKKAIWWESLNEDQQKEARAKYKIDKNQNPRRIFLEQELLENSQVVVPANPNALQNCIKNSSDLVTRQLAEDFMVTLKCKTCGGYLPELKKCDDCKSCGECKKTCTCSDIETKKWEDDPKWTEIKYRVKDPSLFVDSSFRSKKMEGVNITMILGKLKTAPEGAMTLQSLRFPKPEWDMTKAKKWVADHKEDLSKTLTPEELVEFNTLLEESKPCDKDGNEILVEEKNVIPYHDYGIVEDESTPWSGSKETVGADVTTLKKICAWYDESKADNKTSYKLPHHQSHDNKAVWNGVRSAMGALLGNRGGVSIPEADRKGAHSHLAKHYAQWNKDVPEFKQYTTEELKAMFPDDTITVPVDLMVLMVDCLKELKNSNEELKISMNDLKGLLTKQSADPKKSDPVASGYKPKEDDVKVSHLGFILTASKETLETIHKITGK